MDSKTKQEIAQLVREAILDSQGCCSTKCKERCGITPSEHFESHRKIQEFFIDLSDMSRTARSTLVKAIMAIVIGATIVGLGLKIEKFF